MKHTLFFHRALFLVFIFCLSAAIRWYMLPQHLFFGFEQGRDAQIISDIFYKHEFKLVGPKTDLAGIFHGAYYYYLLLPAYISSHGNPLAASMWLVVISSFTAVISYFFARDFFRSEKAAALTALLMTLSYEYIIYARWLSNVTPSIPLILLTFWMLWKYHQNKKPWALIAAAVVAALAAQFEIVLVLLFGWVFFCLFILRIIRWPSWKTLLITLIFSGAVFLPHVLFNLRNQNVMIRSVIGFVTGTSEENKQGPLNLSANWNALSTNYGTSFRRSLSLPDHPLVPKFMGIILAAGLFIASRKKSKIIQQKIIFLFVWFWMCIPVLFFHDVAGLTQLYLAVGLSIIFLFVLALQALWQAEFRQMKIGKIILLVCLIIFVWGAVATVQKLQKNDDVFFVTIQKDLNYADQQKVLQFIHDDAQGQTYRFIAYTIPYLQPEGWQYLQHFLHPEDKTDNGSKLVYVVIEDQVDPFWITKWNEDLGVSTVVGEQQFGLIRIQKRILQ
jgi:hypothetical protein